MNSAYLSRLCLTSSSRRPCRGVVFGLPPSPAPSGFSRLTAAPHAFFCCLLPFRGLERPPWFPWQRSGVATDHFGALPASKLRVAPCATSMLPTISSRPWVALTVTGTVTCVFHAPVTFPREKRPWNLIRIFPPRPLQRPREQKIYKANRDRHRSVPRLPSFLIALFGPLMESLTLLHSSKQLPNAPPETAYETASPGLRGNIDVNSPLYSQRPSREEILTENLCDLPFFFRGPATRRLPPAIPWRPTRVRR